MPRGRLPRAETELVILRVAWNCANRYEWDHHERIGRRVGLTEAEIERVPAGPDADGWNARRRALLAAADEIHGDGRISDATWAGLRPELDERELIELHDADRPLRDGRGDDLEPRDPARGAVARLSCSVELREQRRDPLDPDCRPPRPPKRSSSRPGSPSASSSLPLVSGM